MQHAKINNKEERQQYKKQYVNVFVKYCSDGTMMPMSIEWIDGSRYMIDRITDVRRAASLKCGGIGLRYTVKIQGKQRMLYFEDMPDKKRWFLETETGCIGT